MKILFTIFFIFASMLSVKSELRDKEIKAISSCYKLFSKQNKEPYHPSGSYLFRSLLKNKDHLRNSATISGDEILTLIKLSSRLSLGNESQKKLVLQITYNLCFLNTLVDQVEHSTVTAFFSKLYFDNYREPINNFENIYLRREIQSNLNLFLKAKYKSGEPGKSELELLKISQFLDHENIDFRLTYLMYRYGLPIIENSDLKEDKLKDYFQQLTITLRASERIQDKQLSYIINKYISKNKALVYDKKIVSAAEKLLGSVEFKEKFNVPFLKPRFFNCLVVDENNNGHVIQLHGSVYKLSDNSTINAINSEAKSLIMSGKKILSEFSEFQNAGILFNIKTPNAAILEGESASLPLALLMNSFVKNEVLNNEIAFTGALRENKVTYVSGIPAKISGAVKAGIKYIGLPSVNIDEVNDYCLLKGYDKLRDIQIIGLNSFQSALDLYKDIHSYDLGENSNQTQLEKLLITWPNHISAKLLLAKLKSSNKKQLTLGTSVEQIRYLTNKVLIKEVEDDHLKDVIRSLNELTPIINEECKEFLETMRAYLKARIDKVNLRSLSEALIKSGQKIDLKLKDFYTEKFK